MLNKALKESSNLEQAIKRYNRIRYGEIKSAQELEFFSANTFGLKLKWKEKIWNFYGRIYMSFYRILNKLFPDLNPESAVRKYTTSKISAENAVNCIRIEGMILVLILYSIYTTAKSYLFMQ